MPLFNKRNRLVHFDGHGMPSAKAGVKRSSFAARKAASSKSRSADWKTSTEYALRKLDNRGSKVLYFVVPISASKLPGRWGQNPIHEQHSFRFSIGKSPPHR